MSNDNLLVLPVGFKLKHYIIDQDLGQGGFGFVYKAHHEHFKDQVVIKEHLPSFCAARVNDTVVPQSSHSKADFDQCLERFFEEGIILNKLRHPNIVRCTDLFRANGTAYLVMEFEDGLSFLQLLTSKEQIGDHYSENELLSVFIPLAKGIAYIHDNNILHRDIKPGNVFIRRKDSSPVLLDFGAAKQNFDQEKQSTAPKTDFYSPMEQNDPTVPASPALDIHAFGGLMYRSVVGQDGAEASTRSLALSRQLPDPLIPAAQLAADKYSAEFLALIDQCMAYHAENRPTDMNQIISQLEKLAGIESEQKDSSDSPQLRFIEFVEIAGSDQVISKDEVRFLNEKATTLGIDQIEAMQIIQQTATNCGWKIEVDTPSGPITQINSITTKDSDSSSTENEKRFFTHDDRIVLEKDIKTLRDVLSIKTLSPGETKSLLNDIMQDLKAESDLDYEKLCLDPTLIEADLSMEIIAIDENAFNRSKPEKNSEELKKLLYAPEVHLGQKVDVRAAIYALSAIAYECLTSNKVDTANYLETKVTPTLKDEINDSAFLEAIEWGLALKKSHRPSSLKRWLEAWETGKPLEAVSSLPKSSRQPKTQNQSVTTRAKVNDIQENDLGETIGTFVEFIMRSVGLLILWFLVIWGISAGLDNFFDVKMSDTVTFILFGVFGIGSLAVAFDDVYR